MTFLFSLCSPLFGYFLPVSVGISAVAAAVFLKYGVLSSTVTCGIPTLLVAVCWMVEQPGRPWGNGARFILQVGIPLLSMILFGIHPVGMQAVAYSLYWLVPIVLFAVQPYAGSLTLLVASLRMSMIAHAIGSVIWLYCRPTTPIFWMKLIPVVPVERVKLALIAWAAMISINYVASRMNNRMTNFLTKRV